MTAMQFHRPKPGETFTNAQGEQIRIDTVYHETRREVCTRLLLSRGHDERPIDD